MHSIGEVSRRTGLPVPTIRFYSDSGLVSPTIRTAAGYRRYDESAVTRFQQVQALRALCLDLPTVARVLGGAALPEIAGAAADGLAEAIADLRLREAVLRRVADRGLDAVGARAALGVARLSAEQRRG
ncbi:MerR family transcriptional regulator [Crossiella cryophila]|uniref:DNA-binding transcriptional MerR regulator n=1 Tax=Crossiella cryophila TaxID=43355 RepID=A0A7W7CKH1_9PSEU|nr:MerR family transcriptional regulator [Crossiella cryophila]MBB4681466.1 DNA-binding transcriptional MerR regulator [Crossiella cryophila]